MSEADTLDRQRSSHARAGPEEISNEACEVARLLARAGLDHASSAWFQLLEVATQRACDWSERSIAAGASLTPRAAALLGLRSVIGDILVADPSQWEAGREAAIACLDVCVELEAAAQPAPLPRRRRRWGEGAAPQATERPGLPQLTIGCC